jgi:hypothetical protein
MGALMLQTLMITLAFSSPIILLTLYSALAKIWEKRVANGTRLAGNSL